MADLEQKKMQRIIGANLKKARKIANLSMQEVMFKIWHVTNNKNRLSELENGEKFPSSIQLFELSELYGVSIDYIFGRTREPEIDLQSQRCGYIMQGMRETGIEIMDRLADVLAKQLPLMPLHESEILLNAAKLVIREHKKTNLLPQNTDMASALRQLEYAAKLLDTRIARNQRTMELNCIEQINAVDSNSINRLYSDNNASQLGLDIASVSMSDEVDA